MTTARNKRRAVLALATFAVVVSGTVAGCGTEDTPRVATADPDATGGIDLSKAGIRTDTPEWAKASEACKQYELQPKDRRAGSKPS